MVHSLFSRTTTHPLSPILQAQASRSIGANARRTSHNPPDPALLDMYDRLGMVVMDENRLFANNSDYVQNFQDLVLRDRVSVDGTALLCD
jgi:beta-galactosidase/beta-glucuronidase